MAKIKDRAEWLAKVEEMLAKRYGVENIGIDTLLDDAFAARRSPWDAVSAVGKRFQLEELQAWKSRPRKGQK